MQTRQIILVAVASLAGPACKDIACGEGTIEKNGSCVPADETVGTATCGPFTELQGDTCVPMFPATMCDPATTTPVVDPSTGVITCMGSGGGGCGGTFACADPSTGKETLCGQIYDLETDMPFQAATPTGNRCAAGATDGPCALGIKAYDAISFAGSPSTATPLAIGDVYIDDCGRYRATDISPPGGPFTALGFDDANAANMGPPGVTNAVGVATNNMPGTATANFDAFIATKATTDMWATNGPTIAQGFVVNIYKAHQMGEGEQAGVTFCKTSGASCIADPTNDFYFTASDTGRHTLDTTATATGMNGTALVLNEKLTDSVSESGMGGIDATCEWQVHPGAGLAGIVFVQVVRPEDSSGNTCDR